MTSLWIALGVLAALGGLRYRQRLLRTRAARGTPRVDDDAVRQILTRGHLAAVDEDPPLDEEAARRAEDEFWAGEAWDEPEEYGR